MVVQRGDQWCVIHSHEQGNATTDKPPGTIIKCFSTKKEADEMHKAILISQAKRKENGDND